MKLFTTLTFASILVSILTTGCGGGGGGTEEGGDGTSSGGEVPAQYQGPIASTDVAHGAELYDQACLSCHGSSAPALENIAWSAGKVRQQIREGSDGMPPLSTSRLSDDDMEAILAHMATIGAVTQ